MSFDRVVGDNEGAVHWYGHGLTEEGSSIMGDWCMLGSPGIPLSNTP